MKRIFMLLAVALMLGAAMALSGVAQAGTSTSTPASPTQITYVCVNKTTGQLFYLPSCAKSQTSTSVTSSSTPFTACYQTSNGVTRVSGSTKCSDNPRTKENTLQVPADSDSLYFCVKSSDGTMFFKGTTAPTCPTGQYAVVISPHNQAPVANNDLATVDAGSTVGVAVLANDTDVDNTNAQLSVSSFTQPANGTVTQNADGTLNYTPNAGYSGTDSFTYKASDGTAESNVATVTITVISPDDQCKALAIQTLGTSFNPANYTFHGGTAGNDTFTGTAGQSEVFCGFGGNDGTDTLQAGDIFLGGDGIDYVNTNNGTFNGEAGNDRVNGYNNGTFNGGPGDDYVDSNNGTFNGEAGNDYVLDNAPTGTFNGGDGKDSVSRFNDGTFNGGPGDDYVNWNFGTFYGGDGNDSVLSNGRDGTTDSVENGV